MENQRMIKIDIRNIKDVELLKDQETKELKPKWETIIWALSDCQMKEINLENFKSAFLRLKMAETLMDQPLLFEETEGDFAIPYETSLEDVHRLIGIQFFGIESTDEDFRDFLADVFRCKFDKRKKAIFGADGE